MRPRDGIERDLEQLVVVEEGIVDAGLRDVVERAGPALAEGRGVRVERGGSPFEVLELVGRVHRSGRHGRRRVGKGRGRRAGLRGPNRSAAPLSARRAVALSLPHRPKSAARAHVGTGDTQSGSFVWAVLSRTAFQRDLV